MIDSVQIDPNAVFDDGSLRALLGISPTSLAAARRTGALRHRRVGCRVLYLGCWVLAWLADDDAQQEVPRAD